MTNASSNTETAPATTLPESVRIPLNSLQADLEYLIGRVIADGSCGSMIVRSMRERLDQIEVAITNDRIPVAWRVKNDFGHWVLTTNKALADTWADIEKLAVQPLYADGFR